MVKTVKDAKLYDAPEPDQPGWERFYIENTRKVWYQRTERFLKLVADGVTPGHTADLTAWADVKLDSIADVRRLHFLEETPDPPQGWKKHWDTSLGRGCYLNYECVGPNLNLLAVSLSNLPVGLPLLITVPWIWLVAHRRRSSPIQKAHTIEEIVELNVVELNVGEPAEAPESYLCPITYDLMADPMVAPDGNSYERSAIEQWLQQHGTSPISRQPMQTGQLIPNRSLKDAIEEWQRQHSVSPVASAPPLLRP